MAVGESRSELLQWLNSAFGLEYKKVEQCGTGAAYCQIMDSIYGGVPLSKVKFGASISDYDSRNNMKVLQAQFNKHKITRQIDTERLIRCRLQDNLELLQWLKRHWMENKDINVAYDASARRKGGPSVVTGERASANASRRTTLTHISGANTPTATSRNVSRVSSTGSAANNAPPPLSVPKQRRVSGPSPGPNLGAVSGAVSASSGTLTRSIDPNFSTTSAEASQELQEKTQQLQMAQEEVLECKVMMDSLQTERNFYFNKLRDIEILSKKIQEQYTSSEVASEDAQPAVVLDLMAEIQEILYSTEKGFEIQDTDDVESF